MQNGNTRFGIDRSIYIHVFGHRVISAHDKRRGKKSPRQEGDPRLRLADNQRSRLSSSSRNGGWQNQGDFTGYGIDVTGDSCSRLDLRYQASAIGVELW